MSMLEPGCRDLADVFIDKPVVFSTGLPNHRESNKRLSKKCDFHPVSVVNSSHQPACLSFQLAPLLSAIFQSLQRPRPSTAVHSVRLAACPPQQRFKSLTEPSRCSRSSINTVLGPTNHASRPTMPGRRANHNRRASRRHSTHCHHPASRGWQRNKRLLEHFLAAFSASIAGRSEILPPWVHQRHLPTPRKTSGYLPEVGNRQGALRA